MGVTLLFLFDLEVDGSGGVGVARSLP